MAKKYEYHKRNDYPGERADEIKRVADAKAKAEDKADARVAYAKAEEQDRGDGRVEYANSIADERYDARVAADNKRYNQQADRNRAGNSAGWILALCLVVIAVFAVGILWQPWNQPAATVPNTQTNVASGMGLSLTQAPSYAAVGQTLTTKWDISGVNSKVTSTAVHYGPSSVANPSLTNYPFMTNEQCTSAACNVPGSFYAQWSLSSPGNYYYRVSAVINGKSYWSNEVNVKIISSVQTPQEFRLIANSFGFYDSNHETNTISVKIGQPVELTLFVMNSGTIETDLEFRGCGQNTGAVTIEDRDSIVMYFTPVEDCTISSYKVGGNMVQSTLAVKMV